MTLRRSPGFCCEALFPSTLCLRNSNRLSLPSLPPPPLQHSQSMRVPSPCPVAWEVPPAGLEAGKFHCWLYLIPVSGDHSLAFSMSIPHILLCHILSKFFGSFRWQGKSPLFCSILVRSGIQVPHCLNYCFFLLCG